MIPALVALAIALSGAIGPDDPVCDPEIGITEHCVQPQLPEETIGRAIDPAPAAEAVAGVPAFTG